MFIVHPIPEQRKFAASVIDHWRFDFGRAHDSRRREALERVQIVAELDDAIAEASRISGSAPADRAHIRAHRRRHQLRRFARAAGGSRRSADDDSAGDRIRNVARGRRTRRHRARADNRPRRLQSSVSALRRRNYFGPPPRQVIPPLLPSPARERIQGEGPFSARNSSRAIQDFASAPKARGG